MIKKFFTAFALTLLLAGCGAEEPTSGESEQQNTATEESGQEASDSSPAKEQEDSSDKADESEDKVSTAKLSDLKIHYIDVGQADATLFQYESEGKDYNILFDTGDWRGSQVVGYLENHGVAELDLVVVSHPDADHIGQLEDVMNAFEVGEVWLSGNESSSQTFQRALEAVLASGADYHEPRTGEEFAIGPLEIDVLYPSSISGKANEESVSLLFTYGENRFLFTGDAGKNEEREMIGTGIDLQADILSLGHHGSKTSSDPAFIDAVNPSVAIYSAGAGNSYGHPSPEVVTLIQDENIELYGTDVHGTILVTSDGENYSIQTERDGDISPGSVIPAPEKEKAPKETDEPDEETQEADNSCVNINTASQSEVQRIKHIGPERSQDLIDLRPYNSVDELTRIKGIGPARIDDIKAEGIACT